MSASDPASIKVPARWLPAPTTISRQIQIVVQEPISPTWNVLPKTADEWKALVSAGAAQAVSRLPAIRERLHVKSEPTVIDGVRAHIPGDHSEISLRRTHNPYGPVRHHGRK